MKTQTLIKKIALISLLTIAGFSCSKQKSQSTSSPTLNSNIYGSSTLAYCSIGSSTSSTVQLTAFIDANGQVKPDLMKIRFNSVSSTFYDDSVSAIQIFRWKADNTNQVYLDSTALDLTVFRVSDGAEVQTANHLRWSSMRSSTSDKINQYVVRINLNDNLGEYDAIKIVLYSGSGQVIDTLDALLPVFEAHPSTYAVDPAGGARAAVLQALHPFKAMSSTSAQQLSTQAKSYCF